MVFNYYYLALNSKIKRINQRNQGNRYTQKTEKRMTDDKTRLASY